MVDGRDNLFLVADRVDVELKLMAAQRFAERLALGDGLRAKQHAHVLGLGKQQVNQAYQDLLLPLLSAHSDDESHVTHEVGQSSAQVH